MQKIRVIVALHTSKRYANSVQNIKNQSSWV